MDWKEFWRSGKFTLWFMLTRDLEFVGWLLAPMYIGLVLGGPVAIVLGPVFAALLLRAPFRISHQSNEPVRG